MEKKESKYERFKNTKHNIFTCILHQCKEIFSNWTLHGTKIKRRRFGIYQQRVLQIE